MLISENKNKSTIILLAILIILNSLLSDAHQVPSFPGQQDQLQGHHQQQAQQHQQQQTGGQGQAQFGGEQVKDEG